MKQQDVLKKIGGIISELSEQYQYLLAETEHLNSLELELFVANAHFLTDHAEILRKICSTLPVTKELSLPQAAEEPASAPQPAAHEIPTPSPMAEMVADAVPMPSGPVEPISVLPADEPVPAGTPEAEPEVVTANEEYTIAEAQPVQVPEAEQPVQSEPEQATPPEPETAPVPQIDLGGQEYTFNFIRPTAEPVPGEEHTGGFSISSQGGDDPAVIVPPAAPEPAETAKPEPAPAIFSAPAGKPEPAPVQTLNQRLSAQLNGGNAAAATSHAAPTPVSDLKSAISLNDKLLFVRDLFNGYNLAYSEAIELLNRCKNFDEADRLLKANYVAKNNWAGKQATADKFYAVLHRRFTE